MSDRNSTKAPRVFVSYTHESPEHRDWVLRFATDLRTNGVDVLLDRWECRLGTDIAAFMEEEMVSSDRVLIVCTPEYRRKSELRKGGVGYETMVVTGEIARNIRTERFICVLRAGSQDESIPTFGSTRLFADFREDDRYSLNLEILLRDIHQAPEIEKPKLGANPFSSHSRTGHSAQTRALHRLMPQTRRSVTNKFSIAGHEGYITVGLYDDGQPGEIFITMAREGSTVGGLTDSFGTAVSLALQYGVPLEVIVKRFSHQRFEPAGMTSNTDIPFAKSIVDYVCRWLAIQFIPGERERLPKLPGPGNPPSA